MTSGAELSLEISAIRKKYLSGDLSIDDVVRTVCKRIENSSDNPIWISLVEKPDLEARIKFLSKEDPNDLPLYGIPFAVKDNIDVEGLNTTAACPEFSYKADVTAFAVQKILDAGAILIGKTNLDQFATGLVGTRSPYGICKNAFNDSYISGGSSSGSAVAVALGQVSFALGTDTAGSGRVPAAFNNIIGFKPTVGALSTHGVVPACRSLDCLSIFSGTVADAYCVFGVTNKFDGNDSFARLNDSQQGVIPLDGLQGVSVGVPDTQSLEFFGDDEAAELYRHTLTKITELHGEVVEVPFADFRSAADLLYEGPWVAERYHAVRDLFETNQNALHPITSQIVEGATNFNAIDAYDAYYRLKYLRRKIEAIWLDIDILLTPTAGPVYTIQEVEADPIRLNTNLGYYTNFMNLLDLCGLALPAAFRKNGLPFGVTLAAPAHHDAFLFAIGDTVAGRIQDTLGSSTVEAPSWPQDLEHPTTDRILVAAMGAHMKGLPLNHELTDRGSVLVWQGSTAPNYNLFALTDFDPPRPGMLKLPPEDSPGFAIDVEVWSVPSKHFGSFVDGIPAPLGIGTVELETGAEVNGFLCESYATEGAENISELGSWRKYIAE